MGKGGQPEEKGVQVKNFHAPFQGRRFSWNGAQMIEASLRSTEKKRAGPALGVTKIISALIKI